MMLTIPTYTRACDTFTTIWDTKCRRYSEARFLFWWGQKSLLCPDSCFARSLKLLLKKRKGICSWSQTALSGFTGLLRCPGCPGETWWHLFLPSSLWPGSPKLLHVVGALEAVGSDASRSPRSCCLNVSDPGELLSSRSVRIAALSPTVCLHVWPRPQPWL